MRTLFISRTDRTEFAMRFRASIKKRTHDAALIATDIYADSPMRFACDRFEQIEKSSDRDFDVKLMQIIEKHDVTGVFAASNFDLPALARVQKKLGNITVLTPSESIFRLTQNKRRYESFLREIGLEAPKSFSATEHFPFPCVVKPSVGQGSELTYIVRSERDLMDALSRIRSPLIQKFIVGTQFTIDIFGDENGVPLCAVPRVRERTNHSSSTISRVDLDPLIIKASMLIGERLCLSGLYNIQVIRDQRGRLFFHDINPRLASGVLLSVAAGAPFMRWLSDLLMGRRILSRRFRIKDGVRMFRYQTHLFSD